MPEIIKKYLNIDPKIPDWQKQAIVRIRLGLEEGPKPIEDVEEWRRELREKIAKRRQVMARALELARTIDNQRRVNDLLLRALLNWKS